MLGFNRRWPFAWQGCQWRFKTDSTRIFHQKRPIMFPPNQWNFIFFLATVGVSIKLSKKKSSNDDGSGVTPPNQTSGEALTLTQTVNCNWLWHKESKKQCCQCASETQQQFHCWFFPDYLSREMFSSLILLFKFQEWMNNLACISNHPLH